MINDNSNYSKQILASLVAVLVVTSVFGPIGIAGAQTQAVEFTQSVQGGDTTVAPGETFTVEANVTAADDVNGPAIDVDLPSGWTVTEQTPDGGTYKPSEIQWVWLSGSHTVTYTVQVPSDASAGDYTVAGEGSGIDSSEDTRVTDTDDLTITVETSNSAPTIDPISDQTVAEGDSATVPVSASDPDGDSVSLSLSQSPDFVSLSNSEISITPQSGDAGTYTVEVTADDGNGGTATESFQVTVESTSTGTKSAEVAITPGSGIEASTYSSGSFQVTNTGEQNIESVTIDLSTTTLPDMVFDPDGTAGDQAAKGLSIDSESGDGVGVVSTADGDVFSQPHNGVNGSDGYDVITIEFTDFEPGETVTFSADNDPTSIKGATVASQEAGPVSGLELARATVEVGYADGATQTTQTIGDGSAGGAEAVADSDVPAAPTIGVDGVSLDASALDSRHSAATVSEADQTITVSGPANADVTLVRVEGELELSNVPEYDGTPGYEIEDYEANKAENVEYYSATLDSNGEATIPVTLTDSTDVGGLNYFVAHVEDDAGAGLGSNVAVLELDPDAANTAPTVESITDQGVAEGESLTLDVSASDADGDALSYSVSGPDFVSVDDAGTLTIAPGTDTVGTYEVTVTVSDGQASASEAFAVYVDEPDQDGTVVYAVNAGGSEYTASDGTVYAADGDFTGGNTFSTGNAGTPSDPDIGFTDDDTLYQTERYGESFGYDVPIDNGTYEVTLQFAEIYQGVSSNDSPGGDDGTNENDRLFDASLEGQAVLTSYDIFSEVGPLNATEKTYTVEVTDGQLDVDFTAINDNAKISAIKVESLEEPAAPADFQVSGLTAPDSATQGDLIDVSATVENTGDESATKTVAFRLDTDGDGSITDEGDVVSKSVQLDGGESTTVTFEDIDTSGISPGDYTHGVATPDDAATAQITVNAPADPASFQVSNLDAPTTATQGDAITVSATVENTGDESATKSVEFRVDTDGDGDISDESALVSQDVQLGAGESTTVTFEDIDTSPLVPGDYTHGIATPDDVATAQITIAEPEPPAEERTIRVEGQGSYASYELVTDGEFGRTDTLQSGDTISADGTVATGGVVGFADEYTFTGNITSITLSGPADVFIDGEEVDPADYGTNVIEFVGDGDRSTYEFTVSDTVTGGSGLGPADSFDEDSGSGAVYGGTDRYTYTGELESLSVAGSATVLVDGQEVDPADFGDERTIRIEGSGTGSEYRFVVSEEVTGGDKLQSTDGFDGRLAEGAVRGGADEFTFTGDLQALDVAEGVTVYVDGEQVNPDDYQGVHEIQFVGDGTRTTYEVTVPGEFVDGDGLGGVDTFSGDAASGAVYGGTDSYVYIGAAEPTSLTVNGDATVLIDGQEVATV